METIRTRCPSCHKLYSVDPHLIKSSQPQFECLSCQARFFFEFPLAEIDQPAPAERIPTESAPVPPLGLKQTFVETEKRNPRLEKQCPKSGAQAKSEAEDCGACGIVFAKYRAWKRQGEHWQGLNPAVSEAWERVLNEYDQMPAHAQFLEVCFKAGELPVAARHYEAILKAQPSDETAREMKRRIVELAEAPMSSSPVLQWSFWRSVLFGLIILVGVVFTVTGFTVEWARNLIGVGVSLIVTAISARIYLRYLV